VTNLSQASTIKMKIGVPRRPKGVLKVRSERWKGADKNAAQFFALLARCPCDCWRALRARHAAAPASGIWLQLFKFVQLQSMHRLGPRLTPLRQVLNAPQQLPEHVLVPYVPVALRIATATSKLMCRMAGSIS
jgi:hypothetical protein